jgi:plasmid stability protein
LKAWDERGLMQFIGGSMATITIRNLKKEVVRVLKELARRNHRSMEQEVRNILEERAANRSAILVKIEESWAHGAHPIHKADIDSWIKSAREKMA